MSVPRGLLRVAMAALMAVALCVPMLAQSKKPAPAAGTTVKVDGKVIKSYIEFMAADDKEGRKSLTPGYEKTAQWAADKFKEWGVKPAGEKGTYFQDVPVAQGFAWTTGTPEVVVDGRTFFLRDGDFAIDNTSTPGQTAAGEIVFVGYGISAPAKGLDEYAGVDVKGKIVLAFKGSPKDAPVARGMFGASVQASTDTETWTAESRDQAKITTAYDKGAAAILLFDPAKLAAANAQAVPAAPPGGQRRGAVDSSPFSRPFTVISDINERVFRQVMYRDLVRESSRGFTGRMDQWRRDIRDKKPHTGGTGVKAQIKGYATTTFYSERLKNNVSHNVIGKVEGIDPKLKNQYIVIGGHLDHLGVTAGVIYPGADDDASGAATAMEMARLFATNAATIKPKRTVIFALWCGEELGLLGSEYYGDHPTDGVTMDNVVANFNNDMVGLGTGLGAPGALNFPTIFDVIMKNQDPDVATAVEPSTAGPGGSDYSAFIVRGIESLALMTSGGVGHPDYHDAGDTSAKIDPEILRKNGQFVLQGAINVANETSVNLLIPDRLHLYNGMRLAPIALATVGGGGGGRGGGGAQPAAQPAGPRFSIILNDPAAYGGNVAMIDMATKMLGVGRIEVPSRGDGTWFTASEVTERGRAAMAEFERVGVIPVLKNPSARLLDSVLDAAKKAFVVEGMTSVPDAALAKKINDKNALLAIEFDASAPAAVAARLIELKKLIGDSDNLLLVSGPNSAAPPEPPGMRPLQRKIDEAKQQVYLALIKAGWTKDEIYSMAGVNPPRPAGEPMQMPPPAASRFGGNLRKLG
jgi:hypothetical protein